MRRYLLAICGVLVLAPIVDAFSQSRVIDSELHHLRSGDAREWADFPEKAGSDRLEIGFDSKKVTGKRTLFIRHRDVKHAWRVELNGKPLGDLPRDENEQVTTFEVSPEQLVEGRNVLRVLPRSQNVDDILVGDIRWARGSRTSILSAARVTVTVIDEETGSAVPSRVTILDAKGSLAPIGARSNDDLAVRTGVVYSATGTMNFGLEPGVYQLTAGRGFEYGVMRVRIEARAEKPVFQALRIRREVDTKGLVSCDTHIHTFTHSRHGDATVEERVITIAGEGLDLAIATDHDKHIDLEPTARKLGVRRWFTPVVGNEVTTRHGHFNIFPVSTDAPPPDNRLRDYKSILSAIRATPGVEVVVLNHPRDIHGGFRPFGPLHFDPLTGDNLDGELFAVDGVELMNSAALHSDPMRLVHDWMALLNRGHSIAPIGSSDSHEVWRKVVGQGRTYIRAEDTDPGNVDVQAACRALREGRVAASLGLLAWLDVNSTGPGGVVPKAKRYRVVGDVRGPSWSRLDRVLLYRNGVPVDERKVPARSKSSAGGKMFDRTWSLEPRGFDSHVVLVALGPGETWPHFTIAKSYQPTSPIWKPYLLSVTGAIKIDEDGDGEWTSPRGYAERIVEAADGSLSKALDAVATYDRAVAIQVASLLDSRGVELGSDASLRAITKARPEARSGFEAYLRSRKRTD